MVSYYCYHRKREALEAILQYFIKRPLIDFDHLQMCMRKVVYYGYTDLGDQLIEASYAKVERSRRYLPGATYEMSFLKLHIEVEKAYEGYQKSGQFDWELFERRVKAYDFDLEEGFEANYNRIFT